MALQITITDAGRAEIVNAQNTGTGPVVISQIGVGTGQYVPSKNQTVLQGEIKRLGTIGGQVVADDTIHVTVKDEGADAYDVGEFGLFSASGTLVAVYSQTAASGWIIEKAGASTLLLAVDIVLESLDATSLTFGDVVFINPPATTEVAGVVRLNNTLTSSSTAEALTAAMGKKLQDEKQPLNINLSALSGLSGVADRIAYFTGAGAMALATLTSFARSLLAAANAAAARTVLELANSATIPATSSNTGSQLVQRDAFGNFSAGTIAATLNGKVSVTAPVSGMAVLAEAYMAGSDGFRLVVSDTGTDAGWAALDTSDNSQEGVYVRQFTGGFETLVRQAALLDENGNTSFPGTVYGASFVGSGASLTQLNANNISSGTLPLARGGTGAGDAAGARSNLGLANSATISASTGPTPNSLVQRDAGGLIQFTSAEIAAAGGTPFLDFKNDASIDYDMRIILENDDLINIVGGGYYGLQVGGATVWNDGNKTLVTSPTDSTAGRILTQGYCGLGAVNGVAFSDANTIPFITGLFVPDNAANLPAGAGNGSTLIQQVWNSGSGTQILVAPDAVRMWFRGWWAGAWSAWIECWHTGNFDPNGKLGTGFADWVLNVGFAGNDKNNPYFRGTDNNLYYLQRQLGFTPVRQGGGAYQLTNNVYLGWDGSALRYQIDATDFGQLWGDSNGVQKVIAAIAAMAVGSVASYALCVVGGGSAGVAVPAGTLVAGSNLRYAAASGAYSGTPDGTWRVMGHLYDANLDDTNSVTLCLRVY